jgi:hypothetical protein
MPETMVSIQSAYGGGLMEEQWATIPEFTCYEISNFGRIYNHRSGQFMKTSDTGFGHIKITLKSDWSSDRHTRSVAQMVAEAFVSPPNVLCDQVVVLDGNMHNIAAENLVWRPRWFSWRYTRQLKARQPLHYQNLSVMNLVTGVEYPSIIDAGMTEGLLFDDIWRSTYMKNPVFPNGSVFEITQRV